MTLSRFKLTIATFTLIALSACATFGEDEGGAPETAPSEQNELMDARKKISALEGKVQDLETRLMALNDKMNLESEAQPTQAAQSSTATQVKTPATDAQLIPTPTHSTTQAHVQTEAIDEYRKGKILYDTKRYSDAILELSSFVKRYPKHFLSPDAQYLVGMSYIHQSEMKLAEEELSRNLLDYPHSHMIPDTLTALIDVSQKLEKHSRAEYFRQKLMTFFPHSPHAKSLINQDDAPEERTQHE